MKKLISMAFMAILTLSLAGQVSTDANNGLATDYVGWDGGQNFPLLIQHQGNQDLQFLRNGLMRMRISNQATWTGLNGDVETNVNRVLISHDGENNQPWSMLHLWEGGLTPTMLRPWMNVGTSYTGNSDFMYTGLLNRPVTGGSTLATDAVIAWGCQDSSGTNVDNFRFLFLESTVNPNEASQTTQGLETMRITPFGNVGIGDFSTNGFGLGIQPTHRLDVDGEVRIRNIQPIEFPITSRDCILVGDNQSPDDFVVQRIDFTENGNQYLGGDGNWYLIPTVADDCDWEDSTFGIFTGDPLNSSCNTQNVGIGQEAFENRKLTVRYDPVLGTTSPIGIATTLNIQEDDPFWAAGISVNVLSDNADQIGHRRFGVRADVVGGNAVGGAFLADGNFSANPAADQAAGVIGQAFNAKEHNIGVYGRTERPSCVIGPLNIGVYGEARNNSNCSNVDDWAGYFVGDVAISGTTINTGGSINLSDENIKDDIQPLEDGIGLLMQLQPKTYRYHSEAQENLHIDDDDHYGFIAQELAEVLPSLVESVNIPGYLDTLSGEFVGGDDYLGINYIEIIPLMTQGIKEQQAEIDNLNQRLADLEALVLDMATRSHSAGSDDSSTLRGAQSDFELYQNRPNPFDSQTEIVWNMAREANARILVHDGQGRLIETLSDGQMSEGLHSLIWDASRLQDGTYYYSLEVDGELLIKKAVKIQH